QRAVGQAPIDVLVLALIARRIDDGRPASRPLLRLFAFADVPVMGRLREGGVQDRLEDFEAIHGFYPEGVGSQSPGSRSAPWGNRPPRGDVTPKGLYQSDAGC